MIQPLPTINQVLIVSGVSAVPVSQGGTGLTTLTANRLLVGNGSSVALGVIGSGLSWDGTTLTASAAGIAVGNAVTGGGANRVLYQDGSGNLAASTALTHDGSGTVAASTVVQAPTLQGGTSSGGDVTLRSTSHATKGKVYLNGATTYISSSGQLIANNTAWGPGTVYLAFQAGSGVNAYGQFSVSAGDPAGGGNGWPAVGAAVCFGSTGTVFHSYLNTRFNAGGEGVRAVSYSNGPCFWGDTYNTQTDGIYSYCKTNQALLWQDRLTGKREWANPVGNAIDTALGRGASGGVEVYTTSSGAIQTWRASGGTVFGTVSPNGYFTTRKTSAPADGELVAGEMALWFDATDGAAKLMVKAKTSNGTAVTGSVNLT